MTHESKQVPPKAVSGEPPLQGWKEIAAYLDRDARTARRWELEAALPVRRHAGDHGSVYAYPTELDAWRAARKPKAAESEKPQRGRRYVPALAALAAAILRGPILNQPDPLAEAADSGVVVRQVWTGPDVDIMGAPSPDGRFLSYVHWATGDLALRDLETGEHHLLTGKGSWEVSDSYAEFSLVSPDGSQVVYAWSKSGYELRIVGTDASGSRLLLHRRRVPWLWLSAISVRARRSNVLHLSSEGKRAVGFRTDAHCWWPGGIDGAAGFSIEWTSKPESRRS